MSLELKIIGIVSSVILAVVVFIFLRRRKLREGYAIFWVILSVLTIVAAAYYRGVIAITSFFKIQSPVNGVFFVAIFMLLLLCLYFSVQFTHLIRKVKNLAQENALLKNRIEEIEKKLERD